MLAVSLSQVPHGAGRAYRTDLQTFTSVIGPKVTAKRLDRHMLRRYITHLHERGSSGKTLRRYFASVKSFCNWLDGEGLLDIALLESVRVTRRFSTLPHVPSEAEVKQLLDGEIPTSAPERDRAILELLYGQAYGFLS